MTAETRPVFFISDGTGLTAEGLGQALLSQFDAVTFDKKTLTYVDSLEKAKKAVAEINACGKKYQVIPIVFDSIVNQEVRDALALCDGFLVDIFQTFLKPLERELGRSSNYSVGVSHSVAPDGQYNRRIDAVNFALDNDDGATIRYYDQADLILIGVSRSGKTPTSLYLAMQYGLRVANYPITEDDLNDDSLPRVLRKYKSKLFGLTINPERLQAIRAMRRPESRYASLKQCRFEVNEVESLYRHQAIPFLSTTDRSVEEISGRILQVTGKRTPAH
ncbi:kinase/pyrophosphorylase [Litorivicinus sp.]|jgi:regulator of PEP synthase PpsR (kinase-PPPase family)|nr:kinase/pyrophosphorylase [Litorivicinus sp.]|tara:strand:- start:16653 stop:17480 length:828 start_codon:yes stop_codon:yes gene_type:complete